MHISAGVFLIHCLSYFCFHCQLIIFPNELFSIVIEVNPVMITNQVVQYDVCQIMIINTSDDTAARALIVKVNKDDIDQMDIWCRKT